MYKTAFAGWASCKGVKVLDWYFNDNSIAMLPDSIQTPVPKSYLMPTLDLLRKDLSHR